MFEIRDLPSRFPDWFHLEPKSFSKFDRRVRWNHLVHNSSLNIREPFKYRKHQLSKEYYYWFTEEIKGCTQSLKVLNPATNLSHRRCSHVPQHHYYQSPAACCSCQWSYLLRMLVQFPWIWLQEKLVMGVEGRVFPLELGRVCTDQIKISLEVRSQQL